MLQLACSGQSMQSNILDLQDAELIVFVIVVGLEGGSGELHRVPKALMPLLHEVFLVDDDAILGSQGQQLGAVHDDKLSFRSLD